MTTLQKRIGDLAEHQAYVYLQKSGLSLIKKNYQCKLGEIDLIMRDTKHIVFIEVRCRRKSTHASALESITSDKIRKIIKTATFYLQQTKLLYKVNSRFDVVTIEIDNNNYKRIDWIKNAFTA